MAQVFISYARQERQTARQLAEALTFRKWHVWWDRELIAGTSFDEVIERQLELAHAVVVLWSKASVASDWVKAEATAAAERDLLIPVRIEPSTIPLRFRNLHTVDLTNWTGAIDDPRLDEIERALVALAGEPGGEFVPSSDPPETPPTEVVAKPTRVPPSRSRVVLAAAAVTLGVLGAAAVIWALAGSDDQSGDALSTIGGTDLNVSVTDVDPSGTDVSESTAATDADNMMEPGEVLVTGEFITSPDGVFLLHMQDDGNLTIHPSSDATDVRWNTATHRYPGVTLYMQNDGNLVIYPLVGEGVWSTDTFTSLSHLEFGDDAHIRIVRPDGETEWSTEVTVPDVVDLSENEARAALDELELEPVIESVISGSSSGRVISTRPEAGAQVYRNSPVTVVVSKEQTASTTASTAPVSTVSTVSTTTTTTSTTIPTTTTNPT